MPAPAPIVYRSTDANAPILTASAGSLIALLRACLVDGYGSVRASATITIGAIVSNNDTITIDGTTYTWKTTLTPAANEVLIGASASSALSNLGSAIGAWGATNTNYGVGAIPQTQVQVTAVTATTLTLTAFKGGTAGNSIAISKSAATITLSGATLSGGSGLDTTAGAGWTRPYTGTNTAVFRMGGGNQFYLDVNDNGPANPPLGMEARVRGYEVMTAVGTGTGPFPTVAQGANGLFLRKSFSTTGNGFANRVWTLIADDRTFYLFNVSGDSAGCWICFCFGDFYSYLAGTDNYRTMIIARTTENSSLVSNENADRTSAINSGTNGHFLARSHTGLGGAVTWAKIGDAHKAANTTALFGFMPVPNAVDGRVWVASTFVGDPNTVVMRGKVRGFMHWLHPAASFADQDTVAGSGVYAGRTFLLFKPTGNTAAYCIDITGPWDAN